MTTRAALILASAFASPAFGQGLKGPYVPPVYAPVMPFVGPYTGVSEITAGVHFGGFRLGVNPTFASPFGYGIGYGILGYYGNPYFNNVAPTYRLAYPEPVPLTNLAPNTTLNKDLTDAEFTAKLELIFPAPAEVWLDDLRVEGSEAADVSLTSPPLKVGGSHAFRIRATWSVDGTKYQVNRTVSVKAGERSRLTIVSGDAVK